MISRSGPSTPSEELFAEYLDVNGYEGWRYEPKIQGKGKRPDFFVPWNRDEIVFEVKQREPSGPAPRASYSNPCEGIRKHIDKAKHKFREFKEYCCSLVIANMGDWTTELNPWTVFGAMLGDVGLCFPVGKDALARPDTVKNVFLPPGGRMIRLGTEKYKNTTISSVIILTRQRIENPRFTGAVKASMVEREKVLGRMLETQDKAVIIMEVSHSLDLELGCVPKVVVCEHPCPRIVLPREMFRGPYDERYAFANQTLTRIFAGDRISEIENKDHKQIRMSDSYDDGGYI